MTVVTVSRLAGALGDEVARVAAERLGYRLIGRAELAQLAQDLAGPDLSLEHSPELHERSPSFWERLNEERRRYAATLRRAVMHLAEEDDVVIVGLGAGQVLRGLRQVLRVQVVAPTDVRLERLGQRGYEDVRGPLDPDQARSLMRRRDREGGGYIRYLFNIDWLDATNWDVVLNTGRLTVEQCATTIADLVLQGTLVPTDEDRQRLQDLVLASHVESALVTDQSVWVNGLRVHAANGIVVLEGEVIAEEDRDLAEQVVRAIEGVRDVDNDLRVQPPPLTSM